MTRHRTLILLLLAGLFLAGGLVIHSVARNGKQALQQADRIREPLAEAREALFNTTLDRLALQTNLLKRPEFKTSPNASKISAQARALRDKLAAEPQKLFEIDADQAAISNAIAQGFANLLESPENGKVIQPILKKLEQADRAVQQSRAKYSALARQHNRAGETLYARATHPSFARVPEYAADVAPR